MLLINLFIIYCYLIMAQTTINYIKTMIRFNLWFNEPDLEVRRTTVAIIKQSQCNCQFTASSYVAFVAAPDVDAPISLSIFSMKKIIQQCTFK